MIPCGFSLGSFARNEQGVFVVCLGGRGVGGPPRRGGAVAARRWCMRTDEPVPRRTGVPMSAGVPRVLRRGKWQRRGWRRDGGTPVADHRKGVGGERRYGVGPRDERPRGDPVALEEGAGV